LPKPKSSSSSSYEELGSRPEVVGLGVTENEVSSIKDMKPEDDEVGASSTCINAAAVGVGALESSAYDEPHHVAAGTLVTSSFVVSSEDLGVTVSFE